MVKIYIFCFVWFRRFSWLFIYECLSICVFCSEKNSCKYYYEHFLRPLSSFSFMSFFVKKSQVPEFSYFSLRYMHKNTKWEMIWFICRLILLPTVKIHGMFHHVGYKIHISISISTEHCPRGFKFCCLYRTCLVLLL